jgi:hypothetical protein
MHQESAAQRASLNIGWVAVLIDRASMAIHSMANIELGRCLPHLSPHLHFPWPPYVTALPALTMLLLGSAQQGTTKATALTHHILSLQ